MLLTHSIADLKKILRVSSSILISVLGEKNWNSEKREFVLKYTPSYVGTTTGRIYRSEVIESLNRDICKFYKKGAGLHTGRYLRGQKIRGFDGGLLCFESWNE